MANDKFILTSLDDANSKEIAEILGNKTCRKMMDYLAETNEASQNDIAQAVMVPLNTIDYNLKKLIKAGFVEKTKTFFWSVKGKKIPTYKLAKKHIIISPRDKKPSLNLLRSILPIFLGIVLIAAIAAIYIANQPGTGPAGPGPGTSLFDDSNGELKQFSSQAELEEFVKSNIESTNYYDRNLITLDSARGFSAPTAATSESATAGASVSQNAKDFSETNIQVQGVDEADIVKNDGKYIYTTSEYGDKITIIKAYPAENMEIVSEIKDLQGINGIFINNDKLIVFAQAEIHVSESAKIACASEKGGCLIPDSYPYSYGSSVFIYDISDRENPILESQIQTDGTYQNSRMIGDYVYVISNKYIQRDNPQPPIFIDDGVTRPTPLEEIYYMPYPDTNYVFNTITAIDLDDNDFNSKTYLMGSSATVYVSQENIYLTKQKSMPFREYTDRIIDEVYMKIFSGEWKEKVEEISKKDITDYGKLNELQELIEDYTDSLDGNDLEEFSQDLIERLEDFQESISKEQEKTVIYKINIDGKEIEYKSKGEVFGHILNQFSMDEYDENFRIATTTGEVWRSGGNSLNHLYVLDENLELIGSVEDLAPGEKIYSARFMQGRAYIVTFKKVDPLFVIDVSNPRNPEVLGYLKITGFSDYLHPYDENHVIGIGKETQGGNEDFSWYQGVKVSLFDVSDVENPIETAKIEIGDRGTQSDALYDHKAVLFDRTRNTLVLPIQLYEVDENKNDGRDYYIDEDSRYGTFVWQGAYVLHIDLNKIEIRGKITHDPEITIDTGVEEYPTPYRYPDYQTAIKRSLYMDDVLYTISRSFVKANDFYDIAKEISVIDIGYQETDDRVYVTEALI